MGKWFEKIRRRLSDCELSDEEKLSWSSHRRSYEISSTANSLIENLFWAVADERPRGPPLGIQDSAFKIFFPSKRRPLARFLKPGYGYDHGKLDFERCGEQIELG